MSEPILKALMKLFALLASINGEKITGDAYRVVRTFLQRYLNSELTEKYLLEFGKNLSEIDNPLTGLSETGKRKKASVLSVKVLGICSQINEELHQKEKLIVLARIIEFANHNYDINELETLSNVFSFPDTEFKTLLAFLTQDANSLNPDEALLFIDDKPKRGNHFSLPLLNGNLVVFRSASTDTLLLKYHGTDSLQLGVVQIDIEQFYVMEKGAIVRGNKIKPLYYSSLMDAFLQSRGHEKLVFSVNNLNFRFPNSDNGIQSFNLLEETGHMVGIMGGSGVGKSTLFSLLTGSLQPASGNVCINGNNLHNTRNNIKKYIGLIPQDDLLIEELTVFQNLYFSAQLCFKNLSREEIHQKALLVLSDLGLHEIRHLKVGNTLNKFISGGQRKRLNIALELIREPQVLFVDEPTSGLSSNDSDQVMHLLKELALRGKLVIVNIHQPSSDIFKLFDRLVVLDKGGYTAYNGNPIEALPYLRSIIRYANTSDSECATCGNVNPEKVLEIIEARMVDTAGKYTRERKVLPEEWHRQYKEHFTIQIEEQQQTRLPASSFSKPGRWKQFRVFFKRNFLSKLSNRQYVWLNLLEAPALAFILAFFTRWSQSDSYHFSENSNFPAFLLMCIIVPLFMGMSVSAEDIIRDRKILQREQFLRLSRFSYLSSKVLFLVFLSAFQTLSFVLIANSIFGIHDMWMAYWFTFFGISVFSNLVGLNISSGLNSVVTIYILIPLIIVPQLMLSGGIIRFDRLNKNMTHEEYVPLAGDLMVSRWAYEALSVYQFRNNDYNADVFEFEMKRSNTGYYSAFVIPELKKAAANSNAGKNSSAENELLFGEIKNMSEAMSLPAFNSSQISENKAITNTQYQLVSDYLNLCDSLLRNEYNKATVKRDSVFSEKEKLMGSDALMALKQASYNEALADMVLNRSISTKVERDGNTLIRKKDPIYMAPGSSIGRAHFLAPFKRIGNIQIDTFAFNNLVIWLMSLVLFVLLYFDVLRRIITIRKLKKKS
jgi:ABC-type multidrug transport system ATPase subunit